MRYFILSDIHSNLEALEAVLEDARSRGEGEFVILGDIVGYGANPNEVIARLRKLNPLIMIRGNHDKVVADLGGSEEFNAAAQAAVLWTRTSLTEENMSFLRSLPAGPLDVRGEFLASHGTPLNEDDYLFSEYEAMAVLRKTDFRICFFGHTHIPVIFALDGEALGYYLPGKSGEEERPVSKNPEEKRTIKKSREKARVVQVKIEEELRYLINPGSIGQPRDRIADASYALYDSDSKIVSFIRAPYDLETAKSKIVKAGLPAMLAARLSLGL